MPQQEIENHQHLLKQACDESETLCSCCQSAAQIWSSTKVGR